MCCYHEGWEGMVAVIGLFCKKMCFVFPLQVQSIMLVRDGIFIKCGPLKCVSWEFGVFSCYFNIKSRGYISHTILRSFQKLSHLPMHMSIFWLICGYKSPWPCPAQHDMKFYKKSLPTSLPLYNCFRHHFTF